MDKRCPRATAVRARLVHANALPQDQIDQIDQCDATAAVLDDLIQRNVPVPADTLRLRIPDFGNTVAILLSRMPPEETEPLSFNLSRAKMTRQYGRRCCINSSSHKLLR